MAARPLGNDPLSLARKDVGTTNRITLPTPRRAATYRRVSTEQQG